MIEKALELLKPFYARESATEQEMCWITVDGDDDMNHYCPDCIGEVKKRLKKENKKERKENHEVEKIHVKKNYTCGGYEDEVFQFCDECGVRLQICIIPNEGEFDHWFSRDFEIGDVNGYEIYELLDASRGGEFEEQAERLAGIVIEKLEGGPK